MLSKLKPLLLLLATLSLVLPVHGADPAEIAARSEQALADLRGHVSGASALLDDAAGVLVFPDVVKVGFGGGDEYGEGCLLVDGSPVAYYATAGAAFGLPLGGGTKSEVVLFMDVDTLQAFRAGSDWQVGSDGQVAMVRVAAGGDIAGATAGEPVLAFIFTEQGLAGRLDLDGARFTRLAR